MNIEKLQRTGLNLNEAKIYLILLKIGSSQAGRISKEAQINRTTTYDSLERLIEKGLVTYVISANRKIFKPVNPKIISEQLKQKQKNYEEFLPELEQMYHESKEKEESNIYQGRKGIRSILNDILNYKEYVAFGSSGKFLEIMKHDFIIFQKKKKELNIKSRILQSESTKKTELKKVAFAQFRYLSDKYTTPTTTIIYGNKIAIIVWGETPLANVITSKKASDAYKNYFELLWKIAKP